MKIVVDTSVLIAVITNELCKPGIIAATDQAELIAPISVHFEVINAFSAMFKRQRITLQQALQALDLYQQIPLSLLDISLEAALRLSHELSIYAYDAFLIQCARQYRTSLITLDQGLRQAAQQVHIPVIEVVR